MQCRQEVGLPSGPALFSGSCHPWCSLHSASKWKESKSCTWEGLAGQAWKGPTLLSLSRIGWPQLTAREAGKCSLIVRSESRAVRSSPGGPVAKTLRSSAKGVGLIPGWGTRTLYVVWHWPRKLKTQGTYWHSWVVEVSSKSSSYPGASSHFAVLSWIYHRH